MTVVVIARCTRSKTMWFHATKIDKRHQKSYSPFFTCHKNYTLCSGDDHVDYDAKLA